MTPSNEPTKALMPCPFCGEPEPNPEAYTNEYWVRCPKCDATCATCYSEICARDKWNTRAPLPGVTMGGEVAEARIKAGFDAWTAYMASLRSYEEPDTSEALRAALSAALSLATKPQSAEVREVSEEMVHLACCAYDEAYTKSGAQRHGDFSWTDFMRAALVAYERGRKP